MAVPSRTSCKDAAQPRLMASDGVVGDGLALFEAAREQGVEGIVAKRLDSPYLPGHRTDAWTKIKPVKSILCLVLGYEPGIYCTVSYLERTNKGNLRAPVFKGLVSGGSL
ncbi:MAG TPA: hypothetical protein EYP98_11305 [Planctomycetes bacterium]|nr:hypothetical protein [Planctomycetota bacterium]